MGVRVTAEDLKREHQLALASLSPAQWDAVHRMMDAWTMMSFTAETARRRIEHQFELEAGQSLPAPPGAGFPRMPPRHGWPDPAIV